jgi:hypothetical protein
MNSCYLQGSSVCNSSVVDADCVQKAQRVLCLSVIIALRLVGATNRVEWAGQCTEWTVGWTVHRTDSFNIAHVGVSGNISLYLACSDTRRYAVNNSILYVASCNGNGHL